MRTILSALILTMGLLGPAIAQEDSQKRDGVWAVLNGVDSADLAMLGWTLAGTTSMAAGPQTGLLITFWKAEDGSLVRCVFSLVNASGTDTFETCSLAQPAPEPAQ